MGLAGLPVTDDVGQPPIFNRSLVVVPHEKTAQKGPLFPSSAIMKKRTITKTQLGD